MRAELRSLEPNDPAARPATADPWDTFGWFVLEIGVEGEPGGTLFQALLSTPTAVARATQGVRGRRVLVVDSFEPSELEAELRRKIAAITGPTWDAIVAELRRSMYWEYEARWS